MRTIFTLWAAPMAIFWGWFFLSANDMNFGYAMLSRQVHDFAFQLYGQMLGVDPAIIPGMVARTCVFDFVLLMGLWAFRRRRNIAEWIRQRRQGNIGNINEDGLAGATEAGPTLPAE